MNARYLFVFSALLLLVANGALAGGTYQRARDGKTLVWNNYPAPGDTATWSGRRDTDGYATGPGTLTWSTIKGVIVTGSNIPAPRQTIIGRYSGKMVRGKLEGPVVIVDARGKTFHETFVDGKKANEGSAGTAPASSRTTVVDQQRSEKNHPDIAAEPPAPAEGPSPVSLKAPNQPSSKPAVMKKPAPSPAVDDSLQSLISSPSLQRMNVGDDASPPVRTRLTPAEVIDLADAEARNHGYNLGQYQHPQARYTNADDAWSVFYDQKSVNANGAGEIGKPFSVSVEDKTKKVSIATGR